MKIATLSDGSTMRVCVWHDNAWHALPTVPGQERGTLLAALTEPASALARARPLRSTSHLRLVMPYIPERDVFCLGKNYPAHAAEFARFSGDTETVPNDPVIFTKSKLALCGPTEELTVPKSLAGALDYEAELVVVIGHGGAAIPAASALDHVAGYSVINDTTARDLQRAHAQWFLGKSLPRATPWGPVVVTPDELEPFAEREISATVNGELRQSARLGEMIFPVQEAIACISRVLPLEAGDLIAMGTPNGVGVGFDPPRFLGDGDTVVCRVEGIGELRNSVKVRAVSPVGKSQ